MLNRFRQFFSKINRSSFRLRRTIFLMIGLPIIVLLILLGVGQQSGPRDEPWVKASNAVARAIDSYDQEGSGSLADRLEDYFSSGGEGYRLLPLLLRSLERNEKISSKAYRQVHEALPKIVVNELERPRNLPAVTKIEITEWVQNYCINNREEVLQHFPLIVPGLIDALGNDEVAVSNNCRVVLIQIIGPPAVPFLEVAQTNANPKVSSAAAEILNALKTN